MINVQQIINMVQAFQDGLQKNLCVLEKLLEYNKLEFGEIAKGFQTRSADKLQAVFEGSVTTETEIKLRDSTNYYPRDGFVANIGDEPFKVVLVGTRGQNTAPITIPPNVSYAIISPIDYIKIQPIGGLPAAYQVSVV
jgi:hypothetical protein